VDKQREPRSGECCLGIRGGGKEKIRKGCGQARTGEDHARRWRVNKGG
jgi:hypothetical protein